MAVALVMYFMPSSKIIDTGLSVVPQAENVDANIQASSNAAATKSIIEQAHFVGSETCTSCHQAQHQGWQQSHHSQAFAPANADSVVGDFSTVSVNYSDGVAVFEQQLIDSKTQYQIRLTPFFFRFLRFNRANLSGGLYARDFSFAAIYFGNPSG